MEETALRAMQGLAQELWRREPAFVNADATVGELAWVWGAQHRASASTWKQRLWTHDGSTVA